ncbi:PREDICTED: adipocyte plasma membrane-associated protein-like [Ceratosolen solmsi marchali]|uniref:Adipocyte plasma membrane-associated protein-like n=1 Tax=Ceratosolen solmsi marchali TaxID=326594 RepID=A0AAJ6YUQ3_9HYME|nr:PREDICTED: adipocyte plasma membrane-associated protein-like [Ceratosolen solmsi marchali]
MSYLKSVGTSIIYIGAFLAVITFVPGIPPNSKFTEYSVIAPKKLTDALAINGRLNNAEILFQGHLKGPEAFASYNGELYTGIHGGFIVKVTDNKIIPIVKFGKDCDGLWQESKCGRPLGLKFDDKGVLYACDAYYGIFKVDVKTGKYKEIINVAEPIEGKRPMIVNSLDIANNGDIYWTDSNVEFHLEDGIYTGLVNPSGRVFRYDAKTKKNQVLVDNLAFANGIALSKDEDFIIVAETFASRIIKYNLKGPNAGKWEIFAEGLPGMINSDNNSGFLVSLVIYADEEHPQLLQSVMPHPYIRRMSARLLTLLEAPFKCLQIYYPNYYTEKIIHYLGGFENILFLNTNIVTILRIDNKGKIVDAAYNTDGRISGISTAYIHNEFLWLGTPFSEYISRVPLKQAFPNLLIEEKQQFEKVKQTEKKINANINNQQKPSSATPTPNPTESKSFTTPSPKPVKSKPSSSTKKPQESKSSNKPSKISNQQKSSRSSETNS